jgi:hypothetical protein
MWVSPITAVFNFSGEDTITTWIQAYPSAGVNARGTLFSIVITQKNVTSLIVVCAIKIESTCIIKERKCKSFVRAKFIIYKLSIIYKFRLWIKQAAMKRKICTILKLKFMERNSAETAIWKIKAFIKHSRVRPKQSCERATDFVLRVLCGWSLSAQCFSAGLMKFGRVSAVVS